MIHRTVTVLANKPVSGDMRELMFTWPDDAAAPTPGQFLTIRSTAGTDPLLRRPFAFSSFRDSGERWSDSQAAIIFQKRGKATELLCALETGDTIDMIGPLGNAFPLPAPGKKPVLLAGGIGIGPILYFAEVLSNVVGRPPENRKAPLLIIGARNADLLPSGNLISAIEKFGVTILFCTDDGSSGKHGTVIDALNEDIGIDDSSLELYACGPNPMLKAVHQKAVELGAQCRVSMEQMMACAVGACLGCVIPVKSDKKYARVCTEGPVFDSAVIDWSRL